MSTETITVTINGTSGDDNLSWGARGYDGAAFYFHAGAGNDTIYSPGYFNTTHMYGGPGDDVYHLAYWDKAYENPGEGIDTVIVSNSYSLYGQVIENLWAVDVNSATLTGNSLNNDIRGRFGADTLYGMGGNDTLNGQEGSDTLWGGEGKDTFVFDIFSDPHVDTIADFEHGIDKIDLPKGFGYFYTFIGTERFHNVVRELHVYHPGDGNTYVSADTGGDGRADFTIKVLGWHIFTEDDFLL